MYSLKDTLSINLINELKTSIEQNIQGKVFLDEIAQVITETVYRFFKESIALARVYVTMNHNQLTPLGLNFVANLAAATNNTEFIRPNTPILSLMGTSGEEADWNSRHQSKGHIAIPLISKDFIDEIPMMARLLRDLGLNIDGLDKNDQSLTSNLLSNLQGLFLVEHAATKTDDWGRKIIAAQDFVAKYGIDTVFGFGGKLTIANNFVVFVCFTKENIDVHKASIFLLLYSTLLKNLEFL
jgi:hypothetical protein